MSMDKRERRKQAWLARINATHYPPAEQLRRINTAETTRPADIKADDITNRSHRKCSSCSHYATVDHLIKLRYRWICQPCNHKRKQQKALPPNMRQVKNYGQHVNKRPDLHIASRIYASGLPDNEEDNNCF